MAQLSGLSPGLAPYIWLFMDLSGGGALPGEPSLTWELFLADHRLFFWVKSAFYGYSDLEAALGC